MTAVAWPSSSATRSEVEPPARPDRTRLLRLDPTRGSTSLACAASSPRLIDVRRRVLGRRRPRWPSSAREPDARPPAATCRHSTARSHQAAGALPAGCAIAASTWPPLLAGTHDGKLWLDRGTVLALRRPGHGAGLPRLSRSPQPAVPPPAVHARPRPADACVAAAGHVAALRCRDAVDGSCSTWSCLACAPAAGASRLCVSGVPEPLGPAVRGRPTPGWCRVGGGHVVRDGRCRDSSRSRSTVGSGRASRCRRRLAADGGDGSVGVGLVLPAASGDHSRCRSPRAGEGARPRP